MSPIRLHVNWVVTLCAAAVSALSAEPPPADRAAWERVNVVPMPKRVRLTGRWVALSGAAVVLGREASDQDRIGAEWINDRIAAHGGQRLPVASEEKPPDVPVRIMVGTRDTCRAIGRAAEAGAFRLGVSIPGKRGYVVRTVVQGPGRDVLLGGADPIGALYACVTFGALLERRDGQAFFREAEIVDWPDFETVSMSYNLYHPELGDAGPKLRWAANPTPELRERYVTAMKAHIDRLLSWKMSCLNASRAIRWRSWLRQTAVYRSAFREMMAYARARGIRSLAYSVNPFVGRIEEYPDAPRRCITGTGRGRYKNDLRCWSMDKERRETARRMAQSIADSGITDLAFHDTDTGAFLNPARWEDRCGVCRGRWGDDYAAATVNKHLIFHEEIKREAPHCRLHFVIYPYQISVLTQRGAEQYLTDRYGPSPSTPDTARRVRERYTQFWRDIAKGLPDDVTFCIRENTPENVQVFQKLIAPHGTFTWYLTGWKDWRPFFDESPRWTPTFDAGPDRGDVLFTVGLLPFLPIKSLAVREYTWNVNAPGAAGWPERLTTEDDPRGRGEAYTVVLPHIVRNVFGRDAAPAITRALSLNMPRNQIFAHENPGLADKLTTYEQMKRQVDVAEEGCQALDELFADFMTSDTRLGMTSYACRRFVYLREVFHCSRWMAQARAQALLARQLAKAGKLDDAREAIGRGRGAVGQARVDLRKLLTQRPDDAIYNADRDAKGRPPRWKAYTPGNKVNFDVAERLLAQTERELPGLVGSGGLTPYMRKVLRRRPVIHVARAAGKIEIDGRLTESSWDQAFPAEAFFVHHGESLARADTRFRLLRDQDTLYVGATCWMPGRAPIRSQSRDRDGDVLRDEAVELFLMPPSKSGAYYHFKINASGSVADQRITLKPGPRGAQPKLRDVAWNAHGLCLKTDSREEAWEMELALPILSLGARDWGGVWRANVCRDFKGDAGVRELSSILHPDARDFHDTRRFPTLTLTPSAAPSPAITLEVTGFAAATKTMPDRIATVCEFGLAVDAERALHNVTITAECYDRSAKLHRRKTLVSLGRMAYRWLPEQRFAVGFDQEVAMGGVRVALASDEVSAYRWVRLGGWAGTPDLGGVLGAGDSPVARSGGFLAGKCYFASHIAIPEKRAPVKLVGQRGTIEFWLRPKWHRLSTELVVLRPSHPRRVLLHVGPMRREHPLLYNRSSLAIVHYPREDKLAFLIVTPANAGWGVSIKPFPATDRWCHLACVWDLSEELDDRVRLYLDGKRVSGPPRVSRPERLKGKAALIDTNPYVVQLGSLNTGRRPAPALIDDLRISRAARYRADFAPATSPQTIDRNTAVLFRFDGSLTGEGMATDGTRYKARAVPGHTEVW